jgi:hypothetical protein
VLIDILLSIDQFIFGIDAAALATRFAGDVIFDLARHAPKSLRKRERPTISTSLWVNAAISNVAASMASRSHSEPPYERFLVFWTPALTSSSVVRN